MPDLWKSIIGLLAVVAGAGVALGYVGLSVNPLLAGMVVAGFAALAYGVSQGEEFSVTFGLTLAVAVIWVLTLAPSSIVQRLPVSGLLSGIDALTLTVIVAMVVLFWWVIDIRFLSQTAKNPDTVASRVGRRVEKLADAYLNITRIAFATTLSIGVIALGQGGELAGELGALAADAPWIVANLATTGLGYLSLGGAVPGVGATFDLSAMMFLLLGILIVLLAAAVDNA